MFVLVLGVVWGVILNKHDTGEYLLYLLVGLPIWQVISGSIDRANQSFNANYAVGGLPLSTVIFERTVSALIPFFMILPVVLVASAYEYSVSIGTGLLFLFSLGCLITWIAGVGFLVSAITTIFPDLRHLLSAIMRLAFLATPIIWDVHRLGEYQQYIWLNPFYLPLGFVRSTLSGVENAGDFIVFAPLYALAILFLGIFCYALLFDKVRSEIN